MASGNEVISNDVVATVDGNGKSNGNGKEDSDDSPYVFVSDGIEVSAADTDDTGGDNGVEIIATSDSVDEVEKVKKGELGIENGEVIVDPVVLESNGGVQESAIVTDAEVKGINDDLDLENGLSVDTFVVMETDVIVDLELSLNHNEEVDSNTIVKATEEKSKEHRELLNMNSEINVEAHTGQSSFGQAVVNGVNLLCGVALLSTPYAVKEGGWFGMFLLLIFCVFSFYTGILLRYCMDSRPGLKTYPDIGEAAFGIIGRLIISIVLYVELYATCVEFIILESDNLSSLFPNAHSSLAGYQLSSHYLFAITITLIVLPTVWLRDLSVLSYISAGGVFVTFLLVICLFWVGLINNIGFQTESTIMLNLSTLPVSIGLYGYCYAGHPVLPNIYMSMENRSQYPLVLLASFAICTFLYAGVAILGYMMFGKTIKSQFTLNLPGNLLASKVAVWATVISPLTKYALTISPVAKSLEELMPLNHQKYIYSILIRTALVVSTILVALSVPFFGLVMSLIGSLLTMLVSFIFPCACFLRIARGNVTRFQGSLCVLIIAVGIVSLSFGTYTALYEIVLEKERV